MAKTTIYIAAHKAFNCPKILGYEPIEVGAALRDQHLGFLRDDEGENISAKNKNYCELTAYYWIWKNAKDDIVGLCHYSRYFSKRRADTSPQFYLTVPEIEKILNKYDVILPEHFYWRKHNVATGYDSGEGFLKDLDTIRHIIDELYPDYTKLYDNILTRKEASYCNMVIMRKGDFDQYCTWLFNILGEAEKRIDISDYTPEEKRIFGYMSEILLNLWVEKNHKSVYYSKMTCLKRKGKRYQLCRIFE